MSFVLDAVVTLSGFAIIAMYTWSMKRHFSTAETPIEVKFLSPFILATSFWFTWTIMTSQQGAGLTTIAWLMQLASAALFVWAIKASKEARLTYIFDGGLPQGLATEGPYRYVRHPFYTSYITFWSAWALATGSVWSFIPVLCLSAFYVRAARQEEKVLMAAPFSKAYQEYRSRTGFMLPKIG
ncbi:isoprenylcysteine carboxylmethyltransferase family protein [Rhizobium sp. BK176]|uniref:methyltransferase family protein n=1 Tax=Rhizobium sp. BK176 TaxID=2587071 RepID=UPI002168EB50|nr:isoprenylcysteine carboxylmethyltransferase family protein [Rhizobium sp. BK176]MCS4088967.1 protein-S-isoprenylcysteine O-methyltransferase Ste14 [Rhizobium sp. BK176]